jgi:CRP-like cAMP-binding protein
MDNVMRATGLNRNHLTAYRYRVVRGGADSGLARRSVDCAQSNGPQQNHLLASLPQAELSRLLPQLEYVEMSVGDFICQYGGQVRQVYFPTTSVVSLVYELKDGASSEVAVVGSEGMVGVGMVLANESMPGLGVVRCGGYGFRICSRILKEEFDHSSVLPQAVLRYTEALLVEVAQSAVCSRHHSINDQLARCLLRWMDRSAGNEITLTHESIAASLGVRRECITVAAGKLRNRGLIDYKHGRVTVLDRQALEAQACECYGVIKQTFGRLLGQQAERRLDAGGDGIPHSREPPVRANSPGLSAGHLRALG